jgi:hypothetical protein
MMSDFPESLPWFLMFNVGRPALPRHADPHYHRIPFGAKEWKVKDDDPWRPLAELPAEWLPYLDHLEFSNFPRVVLTVAQISACDRLGELRREKAKRLRRKPGNKAPTDDAVALAMDILGMRCEYAGYVWVKAATGSCVWNWQIVDNVTDLWDLEGFIDVKGVDSATKNLIVKEDDKDHWAYLLVLAHAQPQYVIRGWAWGKEAKRKSLEERSAGRKNYFVDQGELMMKHPQYLLEIIRQRKPSAAALRAVAPPAPL